MNNVCTKLAPVMAHTLSARRRFALAAALACLGVAVWAQPPGGESELDSILNVTIYDDQVIDVVDTEDAETGAVDAGNVNETPAVVAVIKQTEIQEFGANKLTDVLDRVVAMYMTGSALYRQNNAVIRGDLQTHYNTHVLFLLDGRPMRESLFTGLDLGFLTSFPVEAVERIEVLRGPGSVLYGTGAYTGVINIITKKVSRSSVSVSGGSFGAFRGEGTVSKSFKDFSILASAQVFRQDGWEFDAVDRDSIRNSIDMGERNIGALVTMDYKGLSLKGAYSHTNARIMGLSPDWRNTLGGDGDELNHERSFFDVGYERRLNDIWSSSLNLTYNGARNANFSQGFNTADAEVDDYLLEWKNFLTPIENLKVIVGGLGMQVTGRSTIAAEAMPSTTPGPPVETITSYDDLRWAAYTQAEYNLFPFLKLIAGVQANKIPDIDWDFVPRGGVILNYKLEEGQTIGTKLLYGEAFRNPSQFELRANFPDFLVGNEGLEPESVATWDAQVYFQHTNYNFSVNYFHSTQENLIERQLRADGGAGRVFASIGELTSRGIEAEAKYFFIPNTLMFTGSFAWQENEVPGDDPSKNVSFVSNRMIKGGLSYRGALGTLGVFNSFFAEPNNVPGAATVNADPSAFNLLSANLNLNLSEALKADRENRDAEFFLNVYVQNLLDEEIHDPEFDAEVINSLPNRPGRAIYIGLNARFR